MAEGRSRSLWAHTSNLMWAIVEPQRDRKKRRKPYTPQDFNPHVERRQIKQEPIATVNIVDLKDMYLGMGIPVKTVRASDVKVRVKASG